MSSLRLAHTAKSRYKPPVQRATRIPSHPVRRGCGIPVGCTRAVGTNASQVCLSLRKRTIDACGIVRPSDIASSRNVVDGRGVAHARPS